MATEKQDPKFSPIREGYCPQCSTSLNFSEEDRIDGAEIVCPKCSRKFNIEESQKPQSQTPKKKSGLTGGAAALLMFVILGIVGYAIFPLIGIKRVSQTFQRKQNLNMRLVKLCQGLVWKRLVQSG